MALAAARCLRPRSALSLLGIGLFGKFSSTSTSRRCFYLKTIDASKLGPVAQAREANVNKRKRVGAEEDGADKVRGQGSSRVPKVGELAFDDE